MNRRVYIASAMRLSVAAAVAIVVTSTIAAAQPPDKLPLPKGQMPD